tara:strand:- start:92 stop:376 length:285 start_codon:yes stop_codon:yes gene_type:complete
MTDVTAKADRCSRLINDKDLKQAFVDVRNAIYETFEQCPVDDGETLVRLKQRLHLLDSVWANLERAVADGKLEAHRIEEQGKVSYLGDIWQKKQ